MRLLHIIAGGRYGGAETFFTDLVRGLSRAKTAKGVDQHAITRPHPERLAHLTESGCDYSPVRMGGPLDVFSSRAIKRAARSYDPDIVLAWMNRGARYAPKGRWKTVGRLGGYYDLKYYGACDHLICNTPDLVRHCVAKGWPEARVDYIPNFSPAVDAVPVARGDLTTPADATVLLVLARLEEVKAVDVAVHALTDLPDAYLWVAGEGALEKELRSLATSLGLIDRVRFLGWRADREALLKAADICLVPSRHEPFGNVVINAWVAGRPVVAARSQGPGFLIRDGQSGLLVPVDDPIAMAEAVKTLATEPGLVKRLVAGGRDDVESSFSEAKVIAAYLNLFEKLLKNP